MVRKTKTKANHLEAHASELVNWEERTAQTKEHCGDATERQSLRRSRIESSLRRYILWEGDGKKSKRLLADLAPANVCVCALLCIAIICMSQYAYLLNM